MMKPIIPAKLIINSQQAYLSFAKYYPKTLRKLQVQYAKADSDYHYFRQQQKPQIHPNVKTDFFVRQNKRLKGLGSLDITDCQPFIQHKSDKFDLMMKKLSDIRGLTCSLFPEKQAAKYFQHNQKKLIRTFKRLEVISHHQIDPKPKSLYYRKAAFAAPNIKSSKTKRSPYPATLKNVQITLSDGNFSSQLFERLPKKATNISIYPGQAAVKPLLSPPTFKSSFSEYPYLQSLEILLPIQPDIYASILNSISYPDSLTCLRLNIRANNDLMISTLQEALSRFKKLKHIALKFSDPLPQLTVLAPFEDCPLESVEILLSKVMEQNLIEISNLIAKQPQIKHLSLKSSWAITDTSLLKPWETLMNQISSLAHCEKLYLNLKVQAEFDDTPIKYPVSTLFNNKRLQELHLDLTNGFSSSDIGSLMKSIQADCSKLRILELYFSDKVRLVGDDRVSFIEAIEGMPSLKTILLDSFTVEGQGYVKKLLDVISKLAHLKSLKLLRLNGQIILEELLGQIEQIITKPGFEEIFFWGEIYDKTESVAKVIDMKDAFKKNPDLKVFELPFSFSRNLKNHDQYKKEKWNI